MTINDTQSIGVAISVLDAMLSAVEELDPSESRPVSDSTFDRVDKTFLELLDLVKQFQGSEHEFASSWPAIQKRAMRFILSRMTRPRS